MHVILATQIGRDQEDHGSKPAWENSLPKHLSEKKTIIKKSCCSGSRFSP
jgi:hypothetical protein